MADSKKTYVGEIGKRFKIVAGISLANLSAALIYVEKPDGASTSTWSAAVLGAVENGTIYHDTVDGDLSVRGIYRIWCKLTFSDGRIFFGDPTYHNVYAPGEGE